MKTKYKVFIAIYVVLCFFGINWAANAFLPKWIDILIGFPLSMYLIYKGIWIIAGLILKENEQSCNK